jgi:hypothetical protein
MKLKCEHGTRQNGISKRECVWNKAKIKGISHCRNQITVVVPCYTNKMKTGDYGKGDTDKKRNSKEANKSADKDLIE